MPLRSQQDASFSLHKLTPPLWFLFIMMMGPGWIPRPEAAPAANHSGGDVRIQLEKGNILFTADQAPLQNILYALEKEFHVQITGLDDRAAESITGSFTAESFESLIRAMMRHLAVKNYAMEDTDGKWTRVSVFPEARQTASLEPSVPAFEAAPQEAGEAEAPARAVEVMSIVDGSQAQEAGLRKGDIIFEYGGTQIRRAEELIKETRKRPSDKEIDLLLIRDGEPVRVNVKGGFIGIRIQTVNLPGEPGGAQ